MSQKHSNLRSRIIELIESSEIELSPIQIAQKLNANHSSVRVYLPQLVAQNKILTPYPGYYCSKSTHGVRFGGLRVHNIVAVADVCVGVHFEDVVVVGDVKVRVVGGVERQRVSVFVSCDAGMDRNSCLLALDKGFGLAKLRLGFEVEDIVLKTFELNRDYLGVRVDRATCLTRRGLYDVVERVYSKGEGVVRHEHKISRDMGVKEFESLLMGGVSGYNVTQANFALIQEVKKLTDAVKMNNSLLVGQSKILEGVVNFIYKFLDKDKGGNNSN